MKVYEVRFHTDEMYIQFGVYRDEAEARRIANAGNGFLETPPKRWDEGFTVHELDLFETKSADARPWEAKDFIEALEPWEVADWFRLPIEDEEEDIPEHIYAEIVRDPEEGDQ